MSLRELENELMEELPKKVGNLSSDWNLYSTVTQRLKEMARTVASDFGFYPYVIVCKFGPLPESKCGNYGMTVFEDDLGHLIRAEIYIPPQIIQNEELTKAFFAHEFAELRLEREKKEKYREYSDIGIKYENNLGKLNKDEIDKYWKLLQEFEFGADDLAEEKGYNIYALNVFLIKIENSKSPTL
ncbi:MAG: hypothetical protein QMD12_00750 [Candidatus Aenigmarchaeota archaeon]|nr:hypothetical protein [Candidatus Aenigmarchaeota archaeon]